MVTQTSTVPAENAGLGGSDAGFLAETSGTLETGWKKVTEPARIQIEGPARRNAPAHIVRGLARTFAADVLTCPKCQGRMRLLALVKEPASIARYLAAVGEPTEVPQRSPGRGPPYWKSRVLRRQVLGDQDGCGNQRSGGNEAA